MWIVATIPNISPNGQEQTETDRKGQKWTEMDRNGQKQKDTDRNRQFSQV